MMTSRSHASRPSSEAGFTLVEMLAAVSLSVIVLLATLTTLDGFSNSAARQTRITDANDQVRRFMDRVVSDLRQAASITVASPANLVYTVRDSATQTRTERICRNAANELWRTSVTTAVTFTSSCPTPGTPASKITELKAASSAAGPLFRYDSATPADVRSVGLTFALDSGDGRQAATSVLRASAFLRSKAETAPAVDDDDLTATCDDAGVPTLTLAGGVGDLSVTYTDLDGNQLGSGEAGSSLRLTGAGGTVIANIESTGAGIVSQLVKEVQC